MIVALPVTHTAPFLCVARQQALGERCRSLDRRDHYEAVEVTIECVELSPALRCSG